jgi:hypothetical protein
MEVSKLFGRESCGRVDFPEYQRRRQPITLGRRQDGMISLQRPQSFGRYNSPEKEVRFHLKVRLQVSTITCFTLQIKDLGAFKRAPIGQILADAESRIDALGSNRIEHLG